MPKKKPSETIKAKERMKETMRLKTFLFGGNFKLETMRGWYPGVFWRLVKYFQEKWWKVGYTLVDWIREDFRMRRGKFSLMKSGKGTIL